MSDGEDWTDFYLFSVLTQIISDSSSGINTSSQCDTKQKTEVNVVDEDLLLCWHFDTLHGALKAS